MAPYRQVGLLVLVLAVPILSPMSDALSSGEAFRDCCILLSVTGDIPGSCTNQQKILHCTPVLAAPDEIRLLP